MACKKITVKTVSIIMTLVLIIGSVVVPMVGTASAEKQSGTVIYDFNSASTVCAANITSSADDENKTCGGDAFKVLNRIDAGTVGINDTFDKDVLSAWNPGWARTWSTSGAFRFNKNGVGYTLSVGHTYKIDLKIKVTNAINNGGGNTIATTASAVYQLGYGIKTSVSESDGSYVFKATGIETALFNVCSYGFDAAFYSYDTMNGVKVSPISKDAEWNELTYIFTAPDDAEGKDLGLFGSNYTGGTFYMSDFSVTDLGSGVGVVYAQNVLTDEVYIYSGKTGETYTPADCEKVGKRNFKGWYNDANGESKIENFTFPEGVKLIYGFFDGATEITCIVPGKTDIVISGQRGETITLPEVDEFNGDKKFIGWFSDPEYTEKFTETQYGIRDLKVYAFYSSKVTVTLFDTRNLKGGRAVSYELSGYPEEDILSKLVYPVDEIAKTEDKKMIFAEWCTDSAATKPYTSAVFPYTDTVLYSKWIATPGSVTVDFENYPYKDHTGNPDYGEHTSIAANEGVDGSKAAELSYVAGRTNRCFVKVATIDPEKQSGRLYKLSYKYRLANTDKPANLYLIYCSSVNNHWENRCADTGHMVEAVPDNEWHTVEYEYFVPDTYEYNGTEHTVKGIYIGDCGSLVDTACKIYIDDIKMEAYPVIKSYIGFYAMNDDEYDTYGDFYEDVNNCGETIKYPEGLKSGNRAFIGWATDPAGKNMFTDTVHRGQNVTLYAIWDRSNDPITQKFENYPSLSNWCFNPKLLTICDEAKLAGKYGLKLEYNKDVAEQGVALTATANCARICGPLDDNTAYKITFSYNPVKLGANLTIRPATSTGGNIYDNAHNLTYPAVLNAYAGETPGWKTATAYLKTDFTKGQAYIGDHLYFLFWLSSGEDTLVYFDNISIQKIDSAEYDALSKITFDDRFGNSNLDVANPGEPINFPKAPAPFGREFKYWAYDIEGTKRFDATVHPGGETTLYAYYEIADEVLFDYENYTYGAQFDASDAKISTDEFAYSGRKSFKLDRENTGHSTTAKNADGSLSYYGAMFPLGTDSVFVIDANYNYYFTFKYYIARRPTTNATVSSRVADTRNVWHQAVAEQRGTPKAYVISTDEEVGVWHDGVYAMTYDFSGSLNAVDRRGIYLVLEYGYDGLFYFDDIVLHKIPKNKTAVAIKRNGYTSIPDHVIVNTGTDYSSKIPMAPVRKGYKFSGYYLAGDKLTDFVAPDYGTNVMMRWVKSKAIQNFDGIYKEQWNYRVDYSVADFDYELYDGTAPGNSTDNVRSGKYSLHRKGKSMYFENACLLNSGDLSDEDRYTLTFKIKMDKFLHTDGAVKIVSCKSSRNPWDTAGNYYAVISIADLADGEWHDVTYTFNSVEAYAAIQTPGYCSIYIDDVCFEVVDENTPLTDECSYTEYVVQKRDENGNVISKSSKVDMIDISSIIDSSLKASSNGRAGIGLPLIIIGGAAVLVLGGLLLFFIIRRKNKKADK